MTTEEGTPVFWQTDGGCITHRVDADHEAIRAPVDAALGAWGAVACVPACFEEAAPDERAAIELTVGDTGPQPVQVRTTFYTTTGQIHGATIVFSDHENDVSEVVALHAVGHALGLADNVDEGSVMFGQAFGGASDIGAEDIRNPCLLYGPSSLCQSQR